MIVDESVCTPEVYRPIIFIKLMHGTMPGIRKAVIRNHEIFRFKKMIELIYQLVCAGITISCPKKFK